MTRAASGSGRAPAPATKPFARPWLLPVEHPGWVLATLLALSLAALAGLVDPRTGAARLHIDPSADRLLPAEGPERERYERSRRLFGADEPVFLGLGGADVFTPEGLQRVERLTRSLEALPGVQRVLSLATALDVRGVGGDVEIRPMLERIPREPEALERLRRRVLAHPLHGATLLSADGRATALLVSLERMSDRELLRSQVVERITEVARAEAEGFELWVSGVPAVKSSVSRTLLRELSFMLPLIGLLIGAVLGVALRSARGVLLPLAAMGLGLLWTLGSLGWLGQELNPVTATLPALILTIGFTYAMHVVADADAELRQLDAGERARDGVRRAVGRVAVPVVATAVTTAAGFASLAASPIAAVREFGLFSLLGIGFTLLASLTLVPASLALLPAPGRRPRAHAGRLDRLARGLAERCIRRRGLVVTVAIGLFVLGLGGIPRIRVATEFPGNLRESNPVRRDYEVINQRFGGANQIRVLLDADDADAFLEPANLRELEALQTWLGAQPEVGATISIADYVKLLHGAMLGEQKLPDSRRLAAQLLLFGASPETKRFVDARHRTANVLVLARSGGSDEVADLVSRIDARLAELPGRLQGSVTGSAVLLQRAVDDVSSGQLRSIGAAFVGIYAVLVLMFTSFAVGLRALLPNALPIVVYFGSLGWSGITLNPSTSLVGSIALGIAVDDTIHYFARFNAEARRLADERKGAVAALRALMRPVSFTTLGLCLGFLVLVLSEDRTRAEFGMLAAFTIAVAWAADVTLGPALCAGVRIVTLWDVLRLDLGPAPQRDVPLFADLTLRQVRVFALMSDVRRAAAGERLMSEGEPGDDMFVVLGGELEAWVERDGSRIALSRMSRGAVVGEVGYFTGRRTAHVDVVEDALLIRFDAEDLERLRRRYPRTGAVVYRNLNRIQAERLLRSTRRIQGGEPR